MKVLIADDHAIVRKGLVQIVNEIDAVSHIEETSTGKETLSKSINEVFDIIILDISLPDLNGLEVLETIKNNRVDVQVLVLSSYPEEYYATRAFKLGASGYLNKSAAAEELEAAILNISNGKKYITQSVAEQFADFVLHPEQTSLHDKLSNREFDILIQLAKGVTISEIALKLFISPKTVSTYKSRIFSKMNFTKNSELTDYVLKNNLIK